MPQSAVLLLAIGRCKMLHTSSIDVREVTLFISICTEQAKRAQLLVKNFYCS